MWWHAISDSDDTREPIFGGAAGARGVTINFWLLLCFDIRGKHVAMSMTRTMTTMIAAQRQFIIIVYSARWKCLRETFFFFFFYYHSFTLSAQAITNKRFRAHLCVQTRTTDTGFFSVVSNCVNTNKSLGSQNTLIIYGFVTRAHNPESSIFFGFFLRSKRK